MYRRYINQFLYRKKMKSGLLLVKTCRRIFARRSKSTTSRLPRNRKGILRARLGGLQAALASAPWRSPLKHGIQKQLHRRSPKYCLYTAPLCVRAMQFAISSRAMLPNATSSPARTPATLSHPWRFQRKKKENQSPTAVTRPRGVTKRVQRSGRRAALQQLLVKLMWAKKKGGRRGAI